MFVSAGIFHPCKRYKTKNGQEAGKSVKIKCIVINSKWKDAISDEHVCLHHVSWKVMVCNQPFLNILCMRGHDTLKFDFKVLVWYIVCDLWHYFYQLALWFFLLLL